MYMFKTQYSVSETEDEEVRCSPHNIYTERQIPPFVGEESLLPRSDKREHTDRKETT
jgi:hypothetical protein